MSLAREISGYDVPVLSACKMVWLGYRVLPLWGVTFTCNKFTVEDHDKFLSGRCAAGKTSVSYRIVLERVLV